MNPLAPFESSIAERYHEETKYSQEGMRREAQQRSPLEWDAQPPRFKDVKGRRVLLPAEGLPIRRPGGEEIEVAQRAGAGALDLAKLARVLWHTNGCTRIVGEGGSFLHFRAAPSAGAMYPTEVYVATRGMAGLPDGLYDYQLADHSLATVHAGDAVGTLARACFGHPAAREADAVVLVTGIWRRSSWRYRERGYRRALLDSGHVLGNLVIAAEAEGMRAIPLGAFRDRLVEAMVGERPEVEGALVVVPLVSPEADATLPSVPPRRSATVEWHRAVEAVADRFEGAPAERIIAAVHVAGRMDGESETVDGAPATSRPPPADAFSFEAGVEPTTWTADAPVTDTIATRRSTRRFRRAAFPTDVLYRALAFTCGAPERLLVPGLLRTYVISIDAGPQLPPGSYRYESGTAPRMHELSRGTYETLSRQMLHLGLGQEIFVHAGVVIVHTVDLTRAVASYGDRVYRLLGLDAGHLGERLNLAILREGWGVSGCGGYFDDEMNRVLCIPESQAVIYITTLGLPA